MRQIAIIFMFATSGCATTLPVALDGTEKALKAVDVGLDLKASVWEAAVADRIAVCRAKDLETAEQRRECMGKFAEGEKVIPLLKQAGAAYDTMVEALETLRNVAGELAPYLEAKP